MLPDFVKTDEFARMIRHVAQVVTSEHRLFELRDELMQELYVRLPAILEKWDASKGSLDAFLYGFAHNILREFVREQSQLEALPESHPDEEDGYEMDHEEMLEAQLALERVKRKLGNAELKIPGLKDKKLAKRETSEANTLDEMLRKLPMSKAAVARHIGISPQLLNAYIKGRTKRVPRFVLEAVMDLAQSHR